MIMLLMNILYQAQLFDLLFFDHKGGVFEAVANQFGYVIAVGYHLVVVIAGQQAFVHAVIAPFDVVDLTGEYLVIMNGF